MPSELSLFLGICIYLVVLIVAYWVSILSQFQEDSSTIFITALILAGWSAVWSEIVPTSYVDTPIKLKYLSVNESTVNFLPDDTLVPVTATPIKISPSTQSFRREYNWDHKIWFIRFFVKTDEYYISINDLNEHASTFQKQIDIE